MSCIIVARDYCPLRFNIPKKSDCWKDKVGKCLYAYYLCLPILSSNTHDYWLYIRCVVCVCLYSKEAQYLFADTTLLYVAYALLLLLFFIKLHLFYPLITHIFHFSIFFYFSTSHKQKIPIENWISHTQPQVKIKHTLNV